MRRYEIFEPNTKEWHIWNMHFEGKSIPEISKAMNLHYDRVKDVIIFGFQFLG